MAVQWGLGVPQVDIGQQFQSGMDHGRQVRQIQDRQSALRGYVANPNDPSAQNALLVADPGTALQLRDQNLQEEQYRHQRALADLEQHKDRVIMGSRIFQSVGVTDEASYQRALQIARQAGMDVSDVPPHFDQQYVQGVIATGAHLAARSTGPTVLAEGATLVDPATGQVIASGQQRRPRYYAVPPGGRLELDPSYQPGAQGASPAAPPHPPAVGEIQQGYRFRGGDPADPNAWEPVQGGAGQPQAQGTFPRQDGGAFDFRTNPTRR